MMKYTFTERLFKQGNRYYIKIPFNIWKECGQKGMVLVKANLENNIFECKLIPKGEGTYYMPITKNMVKQIDCDNAINISFDFIDKLTRINHDSTYSVESPIRKNDNIERIIYPKAGYCGQICLALLTGLSVDEVIDITKTKAWQCSFTKLIEALDYFGILHDNKITYTKRKKFTLPNCCIVNVKEENISHFILYYKGKYYDTKDINFDRIIGYLEIFVA